MADISWIKLDVGLFDNRKIRELRRRKGGDMTVLIWVMLLTMAGRCNAGGMVWITEGVPYDARGLADELRIKPAVLSAALADLEAMHMIGMDDTGICVLDWEAHQNVEGMDKVREQNKLRKQKQRDRERSMECDSHDVSRDSHVTVTEQNKIRVDKNREDREKEKKYNSISGRKEEGKGGVGGTPEALSPSPPDGEKMISDLVDTQEMDARDAQNDGEGRKTMTPAELIGIVREKMELTDGNADELVKFAREIGSNAVLDALNTAIESDQCYWFGLWAQMMKRRYNQ